MTNSRITGKGLFTLLRDYPNVIHVLDDVETLFGDKHVHGPEGVSFYTRAKVVTARWPHVEHAAGASFSFPTSS